MLEKPALASIPTDYPVSYNLAVLTLEHLSCPKILVPTKALRTRILDG